MNTLGERLRYARKNKGFTQESLATAIGVSRGVLFNIEKEKAAPQVIVINAVCRTLKINKDWLMSGIGEMEYTENASQSAKTLIALHEVIKDLTEEELLYLLEITKAMKVHLSR